MSVKQSEVEIFAESKLDQFRERGEIKTVDDYEWYLIVSRECAIQIKSVDNAMDEHIKRAHQSHKALLATKKQAVEPINEVKQIASKAMGVWNAKCKAEDDAERKRLEVEARKLQQAEVAKDAADLALSGKFEAAKSALDHAEKLPQPPVKVESSKPKHEGTITRTNYSIEIVNAKLIPLEYMVPDVARLNDMARSSKGSIVIPGVKVIAETKTHVKG
jgi:hypothetical protein